LELTGKNTWEQPLKLAS